MNEAEIIFGVEESPEGGYEARAIGHAIFTQADTLEELERWCRTPSAATSRNRSGLGSFAFTS